MPGAPAGGRHMAGWGRIVTKLLHVVFLAILAVPKIGLFGPPWDVLCTVWGVESVSNIVRNACICCSATRLDLVRARPGPARGYFYRSVTCIHLPYVDKNNKNNFFFGF